MTGLALYQEAEIHRSRGQFDLAEKGYQGADGWGVEPQPGLSLLRLAQGRSEAAASSIRRVLSETEDPLRRTKLLTAAVEIMVEVGDVASARAAADELSELTKAIRTPAMEATASAARATVLIHEGRAEESLAALDHALRLWSELGAPYQVARTKVLLALACSRVGDDDGAMLNLTAARHGFAELGAAPDLRRVSEVAQSSEQPHGLSGREVEVLRLLATGMTNRAIADELYLSVKTVDRHVSNLFSKLGVNSRAAATAYAFRNNLA
jgi:DNA-binding NarL/FixJ family response regulator